MTIDKIPLHGHSSFELFLVKNSDGFFVSKEATTHGKTRLKIQSAKQDMFAKKIRDNKLTKYLFEVPAVLHETEDEERYGFLMKYYKGESILSVIESGDIMYLETIIEKVFAFITWCLQHTERQALAPEILTTKIESILEKSDDERVRDIGRRTVAKIHSLQSLTVPVGLCHGDLTFSNIIFSHKIVLIDFLDSFVETPLQDVAKILQEVRLQWSLLMAQTVTDSTKIAIGYQHLETVLQREIKLLAQEHQLDAEVIKLFYVITLLRLFPYIKNETIYNKALAEITHQTEDYTNEQNHTRSAYRRRIVTIPGR